MVNNFFAYGPDGKIFFAIIDFPSSWGDGMLTAWFLPFIKNRIGDYKICVEKGFPRSGDAHNTLVGPLSKLTERQLHPMVCDKLLCVSNLHTSLRQASEWGMRGMQGSFPHCKKRLPTDCKQRKLVLESIMLVHNFHTEIVGSNQIKTVFDPEYEILKVTIALDSIIWSLEIWKT